MKSDFILAFKILPLILPIVLNWLLSEKLTDIDIPVSNILKSIFLGFFFKFITF